MVEKEAGVGGGGGVRTALPKCQLQTIPDYQTCYQLKVEHNIFVPSQRWRFYIGSTAVMARYHVYSQACRLSHGIHVASYSFYNI